MEDIDEGAAAEVAEEVLGYGVAPAVSAYLASERTGIDDVFAWCRETETETEKGTRFERATRFYLKNDPVWKARFSDVWLWAIQCKCYAEDATLDYKTVSAFYGATGAVEAYSHNMLVSTTENFSPNLDRVARQWNTVRLFPGEMAQACVDWHAFLSGTALASRVIFDPLPHQEEAIQASSQHGEVLATSLRVALFLTLCF